MRDHVFTIGEYYHIYNRGVDKRDIFLDQYDLERFIESCNLFNTTESIGSIFELLHKKEKFGSSTSKLVSIVAGCLNPNHFHLLLSPLVEKGIEKYMQRLGGYTKYFNEKYKRSGSLFEGRFKSKYISDNTQLLHVSAYINMNNRDTFGSPTSKLSYSTLESYIGDDQLSKITMLCDPSIVISQFKSTKEYESYTKRARQYTHDLRLQTKDEVGFLPEKILE